MSPCMLPSCARPSGSFNQSATGVKLSAAPTALTKARASNGERKVFCMLLSPPVHFRRLVEMHRPLAALQVIPGPPAGRQFIPGQPEHVAARRLQVVPDPAAV